ncbi:MAG: Gfo/Idh/MocA family oxidoreductase [Bacteroidetes bacterium]|nr:Gfo/Idh/MocA family oxidoreductase [Bacteroidota bacterium]
MIKVGIVGLGYWGPNLVRNFQQAPGAVVTCVADMDEKRRARIQSLYPSMRLHQDATYVFNATEVDAEVLATPINTHITLAKSALYGGNQV